MFRSIIPLFAFSIIALGLVSCGKNNLNPGACAGTGKADTLQVPPNSMKGWEIYSWPGCGDWNYALLYGTNALKSYDEVTGRQPSTRFLIRVWGKNEAKRMLGRIPAGSEVMMIGQGWLQQTWGNGTYLDLHLPPMNVVTELQQAAVQANLILQVAN